MYIYIQIHIFLYKCTYLNSTLKENTSNAERKHESGIYTQAISACLPLQPVETNASAQPFRNRVARAEIAP
jgi:hypothetical protein